MRLFYFRLTKNQYVCDGEEGEREGRRGKGKDTLERSFLASTFCDKFPEAHTTFFAREETYLKLSRSFTLSTSVGFYSPENGNSILSRNLEE